MLSLIFLNYVTRDVALTPEQAAKLGYIRFEQPRNVTVPRLCDGTRRADFANAFPRPMGLSVLWLYLLPGYLPDDPRGVESSPALC